MRQFPKSFTEQAPLPEASVARATELMRSGKLHRYNLGPGETDDAALLEKAFADQLGRPYCVACTSGGFALHVALRSLLPAPGERVMCNAFTLSPVPGAIHNAGGTPLPVETDDTLTIDIADLYRTATEYGARFLVLTHMRGHIADMDAVMQICEELGITLIEDCAHTMGAEWRGAPSGSHGRVACFSTQSNKHLNSGEGGLLVTDDPDVAARAIFLTGSYMFHHTHLAAPGADHTEAISQDIPNYSGRMDRLRAALLRPQLQALPARRERWDALYAALERRLARIEGVALPRRHAGARFVGSSLQFFLTALPVHRFPEFTARCARQGVPVAWFGDAQPRGYTSSFAHWRYVTLRTELPRTREILSHLCDIRLPLTFTEEDCTLIGDVIDDCLKATPSHSPESHPGR